MPYTIIDHGKWVSYKPHVLPKYVPENTAFLLEETSHSDWYEYIKPDQVIPPKPPEFTPDGELIIPSRKVEASRFQQGSVRATLYWHPDFLCYMVLNAVYDVTTLFPIDNFLIEIVGYTGSDPYAEFANKVYDPTTHAFTEFVAPDAAPNKIETRILTTLDSIVTRLEKLEKRK